MTDEALQKMRAAEAKLHTLMATDRTERDPDLRKEIDRVSGELARAIHAAFHS